MILEPIATTAAPGSFQSCGALNLSKEMGVNPIMLSIFFITTIIIVVTTTTTTTTNLFYKAAQRKKQYNVGSERLQIANIPMYILLHKT